MSAFKVAIAGLGNIGFQLDADQGASGQRAVTHAKAFSAHPLFQLVAGMDVDAAKIAAFQHLYKAPGFSSVEAMAEQLPDLDVLVISTPTVSHEEIFSKVMAAFRLRLPKMILLEKPMGQSLESAKKMTAAAKEAGVALAVNFMRRFDPTVIDFKQKLAAGALGKIEKGTVWYSKGILNCGSHYLDLLTYFFGPGRDVRLLAAKPCPQVAGDWDADFSIKFGDATFYFLASDEANFSLREMYILGSKGAAEYYRSGVGVRTFAIEDSKIFPGYRFLSETPTEKKANLERCQHYVAEAIAKHFRGKEVLPSTGDTALASLSVVEEIKNLCLQMKP